MSYDLLLKGARVMDPSAGRGWNPATVGIVGEKIAAVAEGDNGPGGGGD